MSQERTEAIVLRGVDFSETSRIVTFLSPDRGRLACMARGVKRPKSQLAALLDTFNRVELMYYWKEGRGIQQLGDVTLLDGYAEVKGDLEKATFVAFPGELAYRIAHENEPSQALFRALVQGLDSLATWTGDVRAHACWQVWRLLSAAGFEPRIDACAECGAAIEGTPGFAFQNGVTCSTCRADLRLSGAGYQALCALAQHRTRCPGEASGAAEVYRLLGRYAAEQLQAEFRSVRVIDQMFP